MVLDPRYPCPAEGRGELIRIRDRRGPKNMAFLGMPWDPTTHGQLVGGRKAARGWFEIPRVPSSRAFYLGYIGLCTLN